MFKPMGKLGHGKDTTGSRAQQQHASESCFVAKHPVHIHANTERDSGKHGLSYSCVSKCFSDTQLCYLFPLLKQVFQQHAKFTKKQICRGESFNMKSLPPARTWLSELITFFKMPMSDTGSVVTGRNISLSQTQTRPQPPTTLSRASSCE